MTSLNSAETARAWVEQHVAHLIASGYQWVM